MSLRFALAASLSVFALALAGCPGDEEPEPEPEPVVSCAAGGCSSQLCVDEDLASTIITTCEYKPEYACVKETTCGPNAADGSCAWDETPEYLDCLAAAKCAKFGYAKVELADLESNPAAWDGVAVLVCGPVELGPTACTKIGCSQTNPCCNKCSAGYRFDALVSIQSPVGGIWGCSGTECGLTACSPFDPTQGAEQQCYYGTFQASSFGSGGTLVADGFAEGCGKVQ